MSDQSEKQLNHARSSRRRYRGFVERYKRGQLDESTEGSEDGQKRDNGDGTEDPSASRSRRARRRQYFRAYLRWLLPHRYAVGALFFLALLAGILEMVEPLF